MQCEPAPATTTPALPPGHSHFDLVDGLGLLELVVRAVAAIFH